MQIAGIQKTTLVDFPGKIAATLFLRGCNFRCGFCHNPEIVLPEKFESGLLSESELFSFLESRLGKLQGVCITGGEPLLWGGTRSLISHIKALGFAVKLDTNGSYPERLAQIIADGDTDYIAMDIKSPLHKYHAVTRSGITEPTNATKDVQKNLLEDIAKSIDLIMSSGVDYEFRTTVAKPLHHPDDFGEIGSMISGAKQFFIQNFVKSKHINEHTCFEPFSGAELKKALQIITPFVGSAAIRQA